MQIAEHQSYITCRDHHFIQLALGIGYCTGIGGIGPYMLLLCSGRWDMGTAILCINAQQEICLGFRGHRQMQCIWIRLKLNLC